MGLLDARVNAEKITYPVVGEEKKDPDDVIDYDIRDEETKDTSAVINANNQTTTGMANVIPGINAPKLIESTSIISAPRPGYIQATFNGSWHNAERPPYSEGISNYIISDQIGTPQYTLSGNSNRYIVIPADGAYQIDITYPEDGSFHYWITRIYDTNSSGRFVTHTGTTGALHRDTETVVHEFKKNAKLYAICDYEYVGSGTGGARNPQLTMTVTRLG